MGAILAMLLSANPHLPIAREQVSRLEEKAALKTLDKAIAFAGTTPEELAQIWLYIGLAHAGLIHEKEARAAFRTALVIDPELELPTGTNPAWQQWWREAKVDRPVAPPAEVVAVEPPPQLPPLLPPPPPPPAAAPAWRTGAGIGLAAAALIAFASGALVGIQARSLSQKANGETIAVGHALSLQRDAEARATTANVLFGSGAGLLVGGGLLFFWP